VAFGVPVKVTVADVFGQIVTLLEIDTVGGGITVIVIDALCGCIQLGVPDDETLTSVKIVVDVYVLVNVAIPALFKTIVWLPPPLTVYVTVAFGVPVKVTVAAPPEQIVAFAAIDTIGSGRTVMVTDPV
jgi:hypothetical protein